MGVRDVNVLEQHVEKIVLAVAAAGAAFLGYLAIQPVRIPDTDIGPNDVEGQISTSLDKIDRARATIVPFPMPKFDLLNTYRQQATQAPLDQSLVASSNVPLFGPKNMAPTFRDIQTNETFRLATPTPVAPENVTVESWQQLVGVLPPNTVGAGVTAPPGTEVLQPGMVTLPTRDQNAALIQGYIPVGKMQLEMAKVLDLKERLPANLQKAVIYRIKVQRHESTAAGWTDWKDIPATKGFVAPTNIDWKSVDGVEQSLVQADSEFKQIVIPDFYVDEKGYPITAPILTKPQPKNIETESTTLTNDLRGAGGAIGMAPAGGGGVPYALPYAAPTGGAPYPLPYAGGGMPATQPGGAGVAAAPIPVPTPDQVRAMPVLPFAFWDETVQPDHTYQYRVEVDFINPTYHWNNGLKDPKMKDQATLSTGWYLIPNPVVIHPDIAFFITGAGSMSGGGDTVSARVFKKNNGKWYRGEFTTPTGMNISGMIDLVDKEGVPKMEVDTKYTIVDVQQINNGVHVVLKDPSGNLVTRDSAQDMKSSENLDLYNHAQKRAAASAPTPGETTGTAVTPPASPAPTYVLPYAPVTSRPGPVRVNPTSRPARGGG